MVIGIINNLKVNAALANPPLYIENREQGVVNSKPLPIEMRFLKTKSLLLSTLRY